MKLKVVITVALAACLCILIGCVANGSRPDFKNIIEMTFDDTSLKRIFLETDAVMADPQKFWSSDEAYQLQAGILRNNKLPIDMDGWKSRMDVILQQSPEERRNSIGFKTAAKMMSWQDKFRNEGIDHIGSFLPATIKPFHKKVYLTAECPFRCFMTNGNVVFNVTAAYFKNDAEGMMNILLHEVFHIGYGFNKSLRQELELPNALHYSFIDQLQNEGLATYVGYTAQDIFKNRHEKDYPMVEDPLEFKKALDNMNGLFTKAMQDDNVNLRSEAWELGVMQRGYYVLGAVMAKTIDEKRGRDALIKTIEIGPRYFVKTYNSLVPKTEQVVEFEMPEELTLFQQYKQSLLENDKKAYREIRSKLLDDTVPVDASLGSQLNSLGYSMMARDRYDDAVDVLLLATILFPEDANTWDSLGEAYMRSGDKGKAVLNFTKSLELNPANVNAKMMLKQLGEV